MALAIVLMLLGGMPKSLAEKALEADLILEYELVFDAETMKAPDKNGSNAVMAGGPLQLAASKAKLVRTLLGAVGGKPPKPVFVAGSTPKCLAAAAKKGRVRTLAFFKKGRPIAGIEQQLPTLTDLDPDYPKIVAAVEQAVTWRSGAKTEPAPDNPYAKEIASGDREFKGPVDRECE